LEPSILYPQSYFDSQIKSACYNFEHLKGSTEKDIYI
jgi:hypothetical protein